MKGMVFTEFLEMVESVYGPDTVETIIEKAKLPSGGAYTAVGTYDHGEMVSLVVKLADTIGVSVPDLLKTYGRHLFLRFVASYPRFFPANQDCFSFLEQIEGYIHKEVLKLYPDAELPHFSHRRLHEDELELIYRSHRAMGDFAEGLIEGCAAHFGERIAIVREPLEGEGAPGEAVRFLIRRNLGTPHA